MQNTPLATIVNDFEGFQTNDDLSNVQVSGAAVDSRLVKAGDVFFAMQGAKVDGHDFLQDAAEKGAKAVVIQKDFKTTFNAIPVIRVEDPLKALQNWAKMTLKHYKMKVIAITGSVGKTTTKEFLHTLLKEKYRVTATPGNSNSQTSTPLVILNHVKGDEEILILEMGMTHPGQITKLVDIAPPDIAVITTVALAHACNFASIEDIARAKAEIFSHPKTAIGILSKDISNFDELTTLGSCKKVSFSVKSHHADYFLRENSQMLQVYFPQGRAQLPLLELPGKHNLHNFLAAVAVARSLNLTWEDIASAMPNLRLHERRLEFVEKQGVLFVNDSYNANSLSMKAALDSMPSPKNGGKRIAVIGEMLELGKFTESCHLEVAEAALNKVDNMICMGANCKTILDKWQQENRNVILKMNIEDVIAELKKQVNAGDVVLLKGSRLNGLWRVLPAFDNK